MSDYAQWSPRQERFMNDRTLRCSRYECYEEDEDIVITGSSQALGVCNTPKKETSHINMRNIGVLARFVAIYSGRGTMAAAQLL